jgi:hypothetical protein
MDTSTTTICKTMSTPISAIACSGFCCNFISFSKHKILFMKVTRKIEARKRNRSQSWSMVHSSITKKGFKISPHFSQLAKVSLTNFSKIHVQEKQNKVSNIYPYEVDKEVVSCHIPTKNSLRKQRLLVSER